MKKFYFQPEHTLDPIEKISDSDERELFNDRQNLVRLEIECATTEAWKCFNKLDVRLLPRLPPGYRWAQSKKEYYGVIRDKTSQDHSLKLTLYGPNDKKQINYIFQVDNRTTMGFAHVRDTKEPDRKYPMKNTDFRVPGYDYKPHKYNSHVRGHIIDHKDTIQENNPRNSWSTYDPRNYIPEPPDYHWGMGIRRSKVYEIRKSNDGVAYAQFMEYEKSPLETADNTAVPTAIYFYAYKIENSNYRCQEVFNVMWNENFSRPNKETKYLDHAKSTMTTSVEAAPVVVPYSPDSTDRALRYVKRETRKLSLQIEEKSTPSRFPRKDSLYAQCDAADIEIKGVDQRLFAGKAAYDNDTELGIEYIARTLDFGEEQSQLDRKKPIITDAVEAGVSFFKKHADNTDIPDGLADHFHQLCVSQSKTKH